MRRCPDGDGFPRCDGWRRPLRLGRRPLRPRDDRAGFVGWRRGRQSSGCLSRSRGGAQRGQFLLDRRGHYFGWSEVADVRRDAEHGLAVVSG